MISAAHCFSLALDKIHTIKFKSYKVAAGKTLRGINERDVPEAQIRNVQDVLIPAR